MLWLDALLPKRTNGRRAAALSCGLAVRVHPLRLHLHVIVSSRGGEAHCGLAVQVHALRLGRGKGEGGMRIKAIPSFEQSGS